MIRRTPGRVSKAAVTVRAAPSVMTVTQPAALAPYLCPVSQIEVLEIDSRLAGLISPFGGVISGLERLGAGLTRAPDTVTLARLGEVGALRDPSSASHFGVELDGIGCHIDPGVSARIAVMEALERYAAAAGDARRLVTG